MENQSSTDSKQRPRQREYSWMGFTAFRRRIERQPKPRAKMALFDVGRAALRATSRLALLGSARGRAQSSSSANQSPHFLWF